jgi:hypothetical protein
VSGALWLLAVLGLIGAFDTLYYHEWRARLPARPAEVAPELRLHALRDFFYAVLFATLPWLAWRGLWTWGLAIVLVTEIGLTLADFVVERRVRRSLGDVYAGERVTHAVMGVVYGAMLAFMAPVLAEWAAAPTALAWAPAPVPAALRLLLLAMAAGVLASGIRDAAAALALPGSAWPWEETP